jgi:hypothetical protein
VRRVLTLLLALALVSAVAAPVASARTAKLTKAENAWAVPMVNLMKSLSGRVGGIGKQVSDPAITTKGSKAQGKLAVTLANIIVCGSKLKKNGAPPTARLRPYYSALKSACSYYTTGSHQLAQGIGKLDAKLITKSLTTIQHGSVLLGLARDRMLVLAS